MTDARPLLERRSARVILLNETGEALLIRFAVERADKPFAFGATPGDAVEGGESEIEAARRELREELGIDIPIEGPVHRTTSALEPDGAPVHSSDTFFLCRYEVTAPRLRAVTDAERNAIQEVRWWSATELDETREMVFPGGLAALIRALSQHDRFHQAST